MTQGDFGHPPAGWYPDPLGLPQMRWWDNVGWTQDVSEARQPMVLRETTEKRFAWADDEPPTRRERRERRRRERDAERGTVDTWRPSAETLLELEPPRADGGMPPVAPPVPPAEPAIPEMRTEAPVRTEAPERSQAAAHAQKAEPVASDFSGDSDLDFEQFFNWEEPEPVVEFAGFTTETVPTHAPYRSTEYGRDRSRERTLTADRALRPTAQVPSAEVPPEQSATPATANTGPVWGIALLPIAQLMLGLLFVSTFELGDDFMFIAALWLGMYVAVIVLAMCDRHILLRADHEHPAHWAWALLGTPVYLIARAASASRESGRGFGPLVVWGMLVVLHAASVIAVPGLVISVAPTVFSAQAEQSIISDASGLGVDAQVHCPVVPPNLIGQQFTCTAVLDSGKTSSVSVSLQRLNGWIDWRIDGWGIWTLET